MNNRPHLIPCLIAAVVLFAAVGKWPYGYYMLAHIVACGAAIYVAYFAYTVRAMWAVWVFCIMALVFNPIFQLHPGREGWQLINVVSAILFLVAIGGVRKRADADTDRQR